MQQKASNSYKLFFSEFPEMLCRQRNNNTQEINPHAWSLCPVRPHRDRGHTLRFTLLRWGWGQTSTSQRLIKGHAQPVVMVTTGTADRKQTTGPDNCVHPLTRSITLPAFGREDERKKRRTNNRGKNESHFLSLSWFLPSVTS